MDLTIDFETRSRVDIKTGPWRYNDDPSTDYLCLAVKVDDQAPFLHMPWRWQSMAEVFGLPLLSDEQLVAIVDRADTIEAHNCEFEVATWHYQIHKKLGLPDLPIEKMRCSAARASACALPRALGDAAKVLGLPVQKDTDGRAIMMKMCKPRATRRKVDGKWVVTEHWHEDIEDYIKLCRYCMTDVDTERELSKALPHLSASELKLWQLDQKMNRIGMLIDVAACESWIGEIAKGEKALIDEWYTLTRGKVGSPKQVVEAVEYFKSEFDIDLDGLTKHDVSEALEALAEETPV